MEVEVQVDKSFDYIGPFAASVGIPTRHLSTYGFLSNKNIPIGLVFEMRYDWKLSTDSDVAKYIMNLQPDAYRGIKEKNVKRKLNGYMRKLKLYANANSSRLENLLNETFAPPILIASSTRKKKISSSKNKNIGFSKKSRKSVDVRDLFLKQDRSLFINEDKSSYSKSSDVDVSHHCKDINEKSEKKALLKTVFWKSTINENCKASATASRREKEAIQTVYKLGREQWEQGESGNLPRYPPNVTVPINSVQQFLTCALCNSFIFHATTIVECMHTFCRKCIYFHIERSKHCPTCNMLMDESNPYIVLKNDKIYQEVLHKLLPEFYEAERRKEEQFYNEMKKEVVPTDEKRGKPKSKQREDSATRCKPKITSDWLNIEFDFLGYNENELPPVPKLEKSMVKIPIRTTVVHLHKFLRLKIPLQEYMETLIFHNGDLLHDDMTMYDMISSFYPDAELSDDSVFVFEYGVVRKGKEFFQDWESQETDSEFSSSDDENISSSCSVNWPQDVCIQISSSDEDSELSSGKGNVNSNNNSCFNESSAVENVEYMSDNSGESQNIFNKDFFNSVESHVDTNIEDNMTANDNTSVLKDVSTIDGVEDGELKINYYICAYCNELIQPVSFIMHIATAHKGLPTAKRMMIKSKSKRWYGCKNEYKNKVVKHSKSEVRGKLCSACGTVQRNIHQHVNLRHKKVNIDERIKIRSDSVHVKIVTVTDDIESADIRTCCQCNFMYRQIATHLYRNHYKKVVEFGIVPLLKKCAKTSCFRPEDEETFMKCVKDV